MGEAVDKLELSWSDAARRASALIRREHAHSHGEAYDRLSEIRAGDTITTHHGESHMVYAVHPDHFQVDSYTRGEQIPHSEVASHTVFHPTHTKKWST